MDNSQKYKKCGVLEGKSATEAEVYLKKTILRLLTQRFNISTLQQ